MSQPTIHTITGYDEARDAYRQKDLRQALYDAGEVIMADVLVNLHGDDHRARRRLENRLFSRSVVNVYERDLFPPVIAETIAPHVANGRAELVKLGHQMMMNLAAQTAGVDRPLGTPAETFRLYDYLMRFIEGPRWPTTPATATPSGPRSPRSSPPSTTSSSSRRSPAAEPWPRRCPARRAQRAVGQQRQPRPLGRGDRPRDRASTYWPGRTLRRPPSPG